MDATALNNKASYLEDWIDSTTTAHSTHDNTVAIEALPGELQRNFSLLRELDAMSQDVVTQTRQQCADFLAKARACSPDHRRALIKDMAASFAKALKHGDAKVTLAVQTYDMVDKHIRRLDEDLQKFEEELTMTGPKLGQPNSRDAFKEKRNAAQSPGRKRRIKEAMAAANNKLTVPQPSNSNNNNSSNNNNMPAAAPAPPSNGSVPKKLKEMKKKSSEEGGTRTADFIDMPVDPDEPTYCICNQVSYGAMIACDNEECEIEWFHYDCIGLDSPPKGKWYCDYCRQLLGIKAE